MKANLLALGMSLILVGTAGAQVSGGQWRLSPEPNRGRAGVEVRPQPTVSASPGLNGTVFPVQPVAFNLVPAILMSDGTVWANFGFGFEPVVRPCSAPLVVVAGQPAVMSGNGTVLQPARPTYTQPVPAQQTASQQMVAQQRRNVSTVLLSPAAQVACFGFNTSGSVFVLR